jgi:hypothetical protein
MLLKTTPPDQTLRIYSTSVLPDFRPFPTLSRKCAPPMTASRSTRKCASCSCTIPVC